MILAWIVRAVWYGNFSTSESILFWSRVRENKLSLLKTLESKILFLESQMSVILYAVIKNWASVSWRIVIIAITTSTVPHSQPSTGDPIPTTMASQLYLPTLISQSSAPQSSTLDSVSPIPKETVLPITLSHTRSSKPDTRKGKNSRPVSCSKFLSFTCARAVY